MLYIAMTLTAKTTAELQYRVGRLASYAKKFIETDPERVNVKLHGNDHGNILLIRDIKNDDPFKLRDAAPQLLTVVKKIIQNCYNPELRICGSDPQQSLLGVRMTMQDLRDAAAVIHAATDVVVGIPEYAAGSGAELMPEYKSYDELVDETTRYLFDGLLTGGGRERARHDAVTSLAAQLQQQIPEMSRSDALFNAERIVARDSDRLLGYST